MKFAHQIKAFSLCSFQLQIIDTRMFTCDFVTLTFNMLHYSISMLNLYVASCVS